MFWTILFVVMLIVGACLDSISGKIVFGSAVIAIGLLLISWITDISFFLTLAKLCAVVIVIVIAYILLKFVLDL